MPNLAHAARPIALCAAAALALLALGSVEPVRAQSETGEAPFGDKVS